MNTLIGIDFSCNKPAACILLNNTYHFLAWPLELDDKSTQILRESNITITNRVRMPEGTNSSEKIRIHISMAKFLAHQMLFDIKDIIGGYGAMIGIEGSSFGSKGDAGLQLAGYRYILMDYLDEIFNLENIFTYAPLTIKSIAGCASKANKGKNCMIEAFKNENINHLLCKNLRENPEILKKKTNYLPTIDDCIDSYWILKTLIIKEKIEVHEF